MPLPFDDILDNISDGFVVWDNDWRFVYLNPAAERMWRRQANELLGRTLFDAVNVDASNPFLGIYLVSKAAGETVTFSAHSDVFNAWLEVRGNPFAGGYAVQFRDVTQERELHHAALESMRQLEATRAINQRIFDTSLDLILVVSRTGDFIRVSPSSTQILGYEPDEMVGRNAIEFLFQDDLEATRREMRSSRLGRRTTKFETRYRHKDGRIVMLAWTGVWSEPEQQHFFIGRDMTDRIASEERSRRSQRMEAIGQLTGGIAHDFNNLLMVVIGNLELLQEFADKDPEAAELADAAFKASLRGAELTRQLLAFARRQALDARMIAVNERVSATMDLLRRTLGERIEIMTDLAADLWPALVDQSQLESALVNLAINARDAMGGSGRLSIETANQRLDEDYVRENVEAALGDYVMLAVSDTGSGMSPDVLARVFEPFFTTKAPGEGTGLGLSMVYGFVRQSHGHIKIYSEVGRGTTVRLYLPRAPADAPVATETQSAAAPMARPGEQVLVVEDNAEVRKIVAVQIGELGYRVMEAANGEAALRLIEEGARVDLLFTDVVMPGQLTGDELARIARRLRPGLKVLLTSGFARSAPQNAPRSEDFKNLLTKPYRKIELATKLRAALDGRS